MRGEVPALPSPHPLAATLPSMYQGQPFTEGLCSALDDVLAPVLATIDNLPAYLDVATTPEDLLPWLSWWIGMPAEVGLAPERQRELLRTASRMHGWQGTRRGVELAVESVFGFPVEVAETGAAGWSQDPDAQLPGRPHAAMVVRVRVPAGQEVDAGRLDGLVASVKPAHVVHRVEVVRDG